MSRAKVSIPTYFNKMETMQTKLLDFLEKDDLEENDQNLTRFIKGSKITKNADLLKSSLYILRCIINYHHKNELFFEKVKKIILYMKDEIQKSFSNYEIFNIFKSNKLILLFLFEQKIIIPDKSISFLISTEKYKKRFYPQFFYPEFKELFPEKLVKEIESQNKDIGSEDFLNKRKIGQNDSEICEIIRKDSVEEYIQFFERNKDKFLFEVDKSIYETNLFLLKQEHCQFVTYATFFGSMKILEHLKTKLNSYLWIPAIHSQKQDIINFLNENKIALNDKLFNTCIDECIKCHHLDFLNHFRKSFTQFKQTNNLKTSLKYYNFTETLTYKKPENHNFYDMCEFGYMILVEYQLNNHVNSFFRRDEILN